jgi:hypothetical protein
MYNNVYWEMCILLVTLESLIFGMYISDSPNFATLIFMRTKMALQY